MSAELTVPSTADPVAPSATARRGDRQIAIDVLRGAVMILMALDHARDFWSGFSGRPTDLARTTPALFLTRWITHFCAPVFVFLAGTAAFLYGRTRRRTDLARFLATRGLWLVVLEATVVRFAWSFDPRFQSFILQVIWAIGVSMLALAPLVFLPDAAVAAIGLAMVFGHNALDHIASHSTLVTLLHVQGVVARTPVRIVVIYPLVPWIGVMACGFAFGRWMVLPARERSRRVFLAGTVATLLFVAIRAIDRYGDPSPWSTQPTALFTVFSFLNTTKYPPSLCYLLMTLGPSLLALAWLEGRAGPMARTVAIYGRVPLFYYVAHLYVLHAAAAIALRATHRDGFGLPVVYLAWALAVVGLYPLCAWFARYKQTHRAWWVSYL